MNVAAPLWLLGLLPWAALAVWMLTRRPQAIAVSFLPLWNRSIISPARLPRRRLPPLPIIFLLLAIALAIIGAARPQIKSQISKPVPTVSQSEVRLTYLAAADRPHAQVMLRIASSHFDRPAVLVNVLSGEQHINNSIAIESNATKTVFVNLPSLGSTVSASIDNQSPLKIARAGKRLVVAPDAAVPPTLRRFLDVYLAERPIFSDEAVITVSSTLNETRSGIILSGGSRADSMPLTVRDDALTRDVDWASLSGGRELSADWEPLVFRGRSVLIARRMLPVKQVLVSVSTIDWPAMPSFVVFWTNALDWLAGGDGHFIPAMLSPSPGVPGEGCGEDSSENPVSSDELNRPHPNPLPMYRERGLSDLSPYFYFTSLLLLLLATLVVGRDAFPYTVAHGHEFEAANPHR